MHVLRFTLIKHVVNIETHLMVPIMDTLARLTPSIWECINVFAQFIFIHMMHTIYMGSTFFLYLITVIHF